jgi:hypothetical protein
VEAEQAETQATQRCSCFHEKIVLINPDPAVLGAISRDTLRDFLIFFLPRTSIHKSDNSLLPPPTFKLTYKPTCEPHPITIMAAIPASQGPQLEGMAAAIGIFPQYIAQQSETLILKEKVMSLSGDSFSIKTIDGRAIFQVKGNAFSLSGRKAVSDMAGNVLFELRKKHLAIHSTYYAEDASGKQFFQVASKFKCTFYFF